MKVCVIIINRSECSRDPQMFLYFGESKENHAPRTFQNPGSHFLMVLQTPIRLCTRITWIQTVVKPKNINDRNPFPQKMNKHCANIFILGICILVFKLTLTSYFLHHIFIRLQKNSPRQHFEGDSTMSAVITFQKSLLSVRPSPASGLVVTSCHDNNPLTSLALGRSVDKYTIICKKIQANCFSLSPFPTKVKQEKGKNKRKVKQRNELFQLELFIQFYTLLYAPPIICPS